MTPGFESPRKHCGALVVEDELLDLIRRVGLHVLDPTQLRQRVHRLGHRVAELAVDLLQIPAVDREAAVQLGVLELGEGLPQLLAEVDPRLRVLLVHRRVDEPLRLVHLVEHLGVLVGPHAEVEQRPVAGRDAVSVWVRWDASRTGGALR